MKDFVMENEIEIIELPLDFDQEEILENSQYDELTTLVNGNSKVFYLPALKQGFVKSAVQETRLNLLKKQDGKIYWPYALHTFGDKQNGDTILKKHNRDANSYVLGDSGGYQILRATDDWVMDWKYRPFAEIRCDELMDWYSKNCDEGIILDVPTGTVDQDAQPSINTWDDCLEVTLANAEYMFAIRGDFPLLNVVQVSHNTTKIDEWIDAVSRYPLQGWAIGGKTKKLYHELYIMLKLKELGLLEPPQDRIHVLGMGKVDNFWAYEVIAKYLNVRKLTCDTATASINTSLYKSYIVPDYLKERGQRQFDFAPYISDNNFKRQEIENLPDSKRFKSKQRRFDPDDYSPEVLFKLGFYDAPNKDGDFFGPVFQKTDYETVALYPRSTRLYLNTLHNIWCEVFYLQSSLIVRDLGPRPNQGAKKSYIMKENIMKIINAPNPLVELGRLKKELWI